MNPWLNRLKQPFPDKGKPRKNVLSLSGVGVFVTLFLWILRPFGIGNMEQDMFLICLGFGAVTLVFGLLYDAFFRYVLKVRTDLPSWTLGKWILESIGLLIWTALGNYLYLNVLMDFRGMEFWFLLEMILNTAIVGMFPIVFSGLMIQLKAARSNTTMAEDLQPKVLAHHKTANSIVSIADDAADPLDIASSDICYVEAMQNYVAVFYLEEEGMQKEIIRDTVANMQSRFVGTNIVRCHRSYLVNVDRIKEVNGNAQGLKLTLKSVENFTVPVSRSFIPMLRELL